MDSTYLTVFSKHLRRQTYVLLIKFNINSFWLFLAVPTFVSTPNRSMEAYEDRWIQFRCTADGHPKPEIKWTFQGNMIGSRFSLRMSVAFPIVV